MKKIIILITSILCLSVLSSCDNQSLVKCENGTYTITLPDSQTVIEVDKQYEGYLSSVTDELIEQAEDKISAAITNYPENSGYYLSTDSEGYLCLYVEVIRDIDPPNVVVEGDYTISSGCNIDHEHLFFSERISK